jgi:hypothetical protein
MSAGAYFPEAALGVPAHLANPSHRTMFQFGMVFVFPRPGGGFERFDLPPAHELLLGSFCQETAALSRADQAVDVLDEFFCENNMGALGIHKNNLPIIYWDFESPQRV